MNIRFVRVGAVLRTQVLEFVRDFGSVFLSLVFPLLFVLSLVGSNLVKTPFQFTFGVVDPFHNKQTPELLGVMTVPGITFKTVDEARGRAELNDGKLNALLFVPAEPLRSGGAVIQAVTDAQNTTMVRMALDAARARLVLPQEGASAGYAVQVSSLQRSADLNFSFIFPGMLALALVQLGMFATATPLLKARDRGSLRYLLNTPLTVVELLIGQVGMRVALAMVQVGLLLGAGAMLVPLSAITWLQVAGITLLGVAMLVSIGYALAGVPRSLEAGMALIMILNFVMMFGGNIFWDPKGSLALEIVAHLLPASYLADALRQLIAGQEGLWPLWVDVLAMLAWSAAAVAFAARTFSFDMNRRAKPARTPARAQPLPAGQR
ncbi:MAG: ABC transporter permease [Pseudomonadota bacterium]